MRNVSIHLELMNVNVNQDSLAMAEHVSTLMNVQLVHTIVISTLHVMISMGHFSVDVTKASRVTVNYVKTSTNASRQVNAQPTQAA